jgi:hypothetical protein
MVLLKNDDLFIPTAKKVQPVHFSTTLRLDSGFPLASSIMLLRSTLESLNELLLMSAVVRCCIINEDLDHSSTSFADM